MKKIVFVLIALAAGLLLVSACGDGGDKEKPTATAPAATATEAAPASETPPSAAELAAHFTKIRSVMQDVIAKAEAGDVQGTRDAEGEGDEAIEAIIDALRPVDASLADELEALELDYEAQADSDTTDLAVMIQDAQDVLTLLDQAETALNVTSSETTPSAADLAADFTKIRSVMQDVIAKAQAGDVQGTRDAEGEGDEAIEAIIDALRPVDASLADQIETLELDYEAQADSDTTDLAVMIQDAQDVLTLLDQAETALQVSP